MLSPRLANLSFMAVVICESCAAGNLPSTANKSVPGGSLDRSNCEPFAIAAALAGSAMACSRVYTTRMDFAITGFSLSISA